MANENNFKETVNSLFKGMDNFISAKTVVGDAIHVGDTIILPLIDVSFGVGAGAFSGEKKDNGGGGMAGNDTVCSACDPERHNETGQCQESGWPDKDSGYGSGFCRPFYFRKGSRRNSRN